MKTKNTVAAIGTAKNQKCFIKCEVPTGYQFSSFRAMCMDHTMGNGTGGYIGVTFFASVKEARQWLRKRFEQLYDCPSDYGGKMSNVFTGDWLTYDAATVSIYKKHEDEQEYKKYAKMFDL
jgi:hypothetical protein